MNDAPHAARRVAVLIDADNVPHRVIDDTMRAAATQGSIIVACAYRHWTEADRKKWTPGCEKHGIRRIEQAPGPNATDIAMAIDALDLLRDRGLDVICVVSGDRDFAPLAARLRRSRVTAVLMADPAKVKPSNRDLWDAFVELDVRPRSAGRAASARAPHATSSAAAPASRAPVVKAILERLGDPALKTDHDGWAILNEIGKAIPAALKKPSLSKAIDAAVAAGDADSIEIAKRPGIGRSAAALWIRRRPGRA